MFVAVVLILVKRYKQPTCLPTDEWISKIPHSGMLPRYKKEWNTDTCYSIDEHYSQQLSKWKKPDTKDHIVYDSFIENVHNRQISWDRSRLAVARGCRSGKWEQSLNGFGPPKGWWEISRDDGGDGCTTLPIYLNTPELYTLSWLWCKCYVMLCFTAVKRAVAAKASFTFVSLASLMAETSASTV